MSDVAEAPPNTSSITFAAAVHLIDGHGHENHQALDNVLPRLLNAQLNQPAGQYADDQTAEQRSQDRSSPAMMMAGQASDAAVRLPDCSIEAGAPDGQEVRPATKIKSIPLGQGSHSSSTLS